MKKHPTYDTLLSYVTSLSPYTQPYTLKKQKTKNIISLSPTTTT